jgi:hypothetical protein
MILLHDGKVALDVPLSKLSGLFVKFRRRVGEVNAVFDDPECVEVCLNSDGSTSHVAMASLVEKYRLSGDVLDNRGITAEEIFIFYTRSKWR